MTASDGTVIGTTKILDHGSATVRWNLVLLGDGYRQQELGQFASDAQGFVDTLLVTPPFDDLQAAINVFRVDVASTDSGADDPAACGGTGATADTFFDATFCGDGSNQRLLVVNDATVSQVASDEVPEWHVALVVVNSSVYGGSGSPANGLAVFSLADQAVLIALHELGHAGFELADEYPTCAGCDSGETGHDNYAGGEPDRANVTANTDRQSLKWGDLVQATTAVPTTENANCTQCDTQPSSVPPGTVGAFEGAGYFHCGLYRPEFECRMRSHVRPFCVVCQRRIRETLEPFLPPIRSPMNYTVIENVRQHFGDEPDFLPGSFVGQQKNFSFDCPSINVSEVAVLMFQSLHVTHTRNVFQINGETVSGDLPTNADDRDAWAGQVLLIRPNVLRRAGNVLHVESRTDSGGTSGDIDDFVIDNVVVFYKTALDRLPGLPAA
jgi:IgA Peptidase M64